MEGKCSTLGFGREQPGETRQRFGRVNNQRSTAHSRDRGKEGFVISQKAGIVAFITITITITKHELIEGAPHGC
jgi:hypothetical protein